MSFILDALKKSETERQRQSLPGLMDTPAAQHRGRLPLWAILLGALLALNIVVLCVMLMRGGGGPAAASVVEKRANAAALENEPAAVAEHFSPLGPAPVYAPEIPVTSADSTGGAGATSAPASGAPHSLAQRSAPRPASRRSDPVLIDEDAKADNDEVLPSIDEINLTGSRALPELHLDVHVYATKASDRFVYINMRKYHEGNSLPEGPVVEHIRRDGVVLNYQGLRFILPRQS